MLLSLTLKNTTKKNKSIISSHVSSVNNAPAFTNFLSVSSVCSTSFLDPLEQFEMFSLLTINHSSMFNSLALFLFANLAIAAFLLLTYTVSAPTHNTYSMATYALYSLVKTTVKENLAIKRQQYFAPLFYLFITILLANLVGLFPFSFTVTSSFIFTLFIALMHFSGINLIGVFQHKWQIFELFLPSGAPTPIAPFLALIEFVSYVARVLSLSIRLFANMMSGHALLKILIGFSWALLTSGSAMIILAIFPWAIVSAVIYLELLIAFLQAYVFTVLITLYINDVLTFHD